jgi:hypothetical protein
VYGQLLSKPDGERRAVVFEYDGLPPPGEPPQQRKGGAIMSNDELLNLAALPVVRRPSSTSTSAMNYDAADLLEDLIKSDALRQLFSERSPRINAQWLATASFLCEPRSYCRAVYRFAYVVLAPQLLNGGLYLIIAYIASGNFALFQLQSSLLDNMRRTCEPQTDLTNLLGNNATALLPDESTDLRTPACVLFIFYLSVVAETALFLWALSALPMTQRPWRSALRELPDPALLLLVLQKLGVVDAVSTPCGIERFRDHQTPPVPWHHSQAYTCPIHPVCPHAPHSPLHQRRAPARWFAGRRERARPLCRP